MPKTHTQKPNNYKKNKFPYETPFPLPFYTLLISFFKTNW
jgi:hypothetical protein